jgi:hypothetical protein
MSELFSVNGASFVGTATNQPIGLEHNVLANAVGTVTATFYPSPIPLESVGTGDGVTVAFTLAHPPVLSGSEKVYLNGVLKVLTTDYTIVNATGVITFVIAPLTGVLVTATYSGTITKAIPMVAGQAIKIGGIVTTVTSTASITLS